MPGLELIIGNKNYSSWSLRPWILLKHKQIAFTETRIPLYQPGSVEALRQHSEVAKVPVLKFAGVTMWDSLAICETIAELFPEKQCWPDDPAQRCEARAISGEMHSGFLTLRNTLPMNCRQDMVFAHADTALAADIDRVQHIWRNCKRRFGRSGPFLFGRFSIADAMYAPVVLRFHCYRIPTDEACATYMADMLALPEMQQWIAAGRAESERVEEYEFSS